MKKRKIPTPWLTVLAFGLLGSLIAVWLTSYRFSGYILLCIAAVIAFYQLLPVLGRKRPKAVKCLRSIMTIVLCIVLLAAAITGVIIIQASYGNPQADCDYLIVLGAGVRGTVPSLSLKNRLDAAYDYLLQHPDTVCIVSGGQGPGEDITEADCMYTYLVNAGIPESRILREDKATSTQENLTYSLALMERTEDTRIGILSSEYHLLRAKLMARDQGIDPIMVPAETTRLSLRMNYYLREVAGVWYYMIFGG